MKKSHSQLCTGESGIPKGAYYPLEPEIAAKKKTLLLHSCCGPCSTACIERVLPDYKVTVFFFNPNITDPKEYELRRDTQIQFLRSYNQGLDGEDTVSFIEGNYEPESFLRLTEGYEEEPEGGERCTVCFRLRLEETARRAKCGGYDFFATTLTAVSYTHLQ